MATARSTLYKVSLKPDGTKQEALTPQGKKIPCVDGLIIDRTTDKLYPCNSRENAIEVVDLRNNNAVATLAQHGDTDGAGGLPDQPAEVLLKGKRLYVSDFDKPEKTSSTASPTPRTPCR